MKNPIENRLKTYKSDLSKFHLIECSMKELESRMQVIEPSYISAVRYSETPKSVTNKFTSIVENTAIENEKNKAELDRLKADLWQLAKDRIAIQCRVEYVQALIEGLTAEERFIVERYYFDGLTWPMVAERYKKEYGYYKAVRTLKYKREDALERMRRNAAYEKSPV